MYILGINAYHGDAAAAIICDGRLIAAVEEERFNRVKHCAGFPTQAVEYCLQAAGISIEEVEHIGISRNPSANLHKKILAVAKRAAVTGQWSVVSGLTRRAEAAKDPMRAIAEDDNAALNANGGGNGNGHATGFAR